MSGQIMVTSRWSDDKISVLNGQWTATLGWDVSGAASEAAAMASVPASEGATHPRSGYLRCKGLSVERNAPSLYRVLASYQSATIGGGGGGGGGGEGDVLDTAVRWRWSTGHQSVHVSEDCNGNAIVNSTGEPAADGVWREETLIALSVARTDPYYDILWALKFIDHVNEDAFSIAGITIHPLLGLLRSIVPNEDIIAGGGPIRVEYNFEFRLPKTPLERAGSVSPWDYAIPDLGYHAYYIDGKDSAGRPLYKYGALHGSDGKPLTTPVRLNGYGRPVNGKIKVTELLMDPAETSWEMKVDKVGDGAEAAYLLRYPRYPRAIFAELGF